MIESLKKLRPLIGQTPLRQLDCYDLDLYAKLEYNNFSGSIKDRPAYNILFKGITEGRINSETIVIESSSGNFAIALASMCKRLGLTFIPVIDPNINPDYEKLLRLLVPKVVKVEQIDKTGGYLLTRLDYIENALGKHANMYWPNQYENPDNYGAYYNTLGTEVCDSIDQLDYIFIAVSSCGTITGLSRKLKEYYKQVKVVAVDVEGSVIFNQTPKRRNFSGMGSSKRPSTVDHAYIDDVMIVSEDQIVEGCVSLLHEHSIFAGASSGAVYSAINDYRRIGNFPVGAKVLFLCPDRGSAYLNSVYKKESGKDQLSKKIMKVNM